MSLHGAAEVAPRESRFWTLLAWLVALALGIALLLVIRGPHKIGDYFAETDFYGAYAEGARLVEHGHLVPSRYGVIGPGYEVALGLAGFVVRDLFLAAQLLSLLATLATLMLWYYLLERRAGARVAFLATLFMASNAYFFRHGYGAMTDAPAIALQAAALFFLLAESGGRAIAIAGLCAGLAFLTRYNAVYLLPAALAALLGGGALETRRGRGALLFSVGFFAPVVPWLLYSLAHGGGFSFQLHHNIAYDVFARARGIAWDDYQRDLQPQFKSLWDVIARDPRAVFSRLLWNVGDHLRQDARQLLGWPLAAAAALGLVISIRDGNLRRLWPLGVAGMLLFATLVPVFYSERYSLALLPIYATLAALALGSPLYAIAIGRRVWLKPLLAAFPIAFALSASAKLQAHVFDQLPVEVLECADTLKQLRAPGDRIIARKWHIAYHGDVEPLGFPFAKTLPELARYAREGHARWLYFSWPEAETRPQFYFLLDTAAVVPGLTPRRVTHPHPAVLYEIGPRFGETPAWFANDTLKTYYDTYARLMIDGSQVPLLYKLGGLAWMMGRYDQSRQALEAALRYHPNDLEVLMLLGNVLIMSGDAPRARQVFERAERLSPGNVAARLGRGWASIVAGNPNEAGELWRPVIAMTTNPRTLEKMVVLYQTLGDHEAAALAETTLRRARGGR